MCSPRKLTLKEARMPRVARVLRLERLALSPERKLQVEKQRRRAGLRSRLRKSLTMQYSLIRKLMKELPRKPPDSNQSQLLKWSTSSRLTVPSQER